MNFDISFSLDWVLGILTVGCVLLFLQILLDYSRQAARLRPQLKQILDIRLRHETEIQKVERLIGEAEQKAEELEKEIEELDKRQAELEKILQAITAGKDDEDGKG